MLRLVTVITTCLISAPLLAAEAPMSPLRVAALAEINAQCRPPGGGAMTANYVDRVDMVSKVLRDIQDQAAERDPAVAAYNDCVNDLRLRQLSTGAEAAAAAAKDKEYEGWLFTCGDVNEVVVAGENTPAGRAHILLDEFERFSSYRSRMPGSGSGGEKSYWEETVTELKAGNRAPNGVKLSPEERSYRLCWAEYRLKVIAEAAPVSP